MAWMDTFIDNLLGANGGPYLGNLGAPVIANPAMIQCCLEYKASRTPKFLSDRVWIVNNLEVKKQTTVNELNALLRNASLYGDLVEQIDFSTSEELVSSDVVGNSHGCEIDSKATIVSEDGKRIVIYAWYDNEYGYTCQVIRLAKHLAGVRRLIYY
jgi:glyceraldehyde-3-phosphate dehydrogenase/erythrose-4-phosphate dehydrogenase